MMITNFKNLAVSPLRKKALLIAEAGYEAINIEKYIKENFKKQKIDLKKYERIFLVGVGKGSALACAALAKILDKKLTKGIALDVQKPKLKINNSRRPAGMAKLKILTGTHPLPSQQNIEATLEIIELAKNLEKDDLLITFICGGGSALLCGSKEELDYSRSVFENLTKAGANILELNAVRKHLSEVKGGGLAKFAYPASVISLIVSDVLGNDLSMVASGPTVRDKTSKKDAEKILEKYGINPDKFDLKETPKEEKYFKKVKNILFLSNREPILAMAEKAGKLGLKPKIHSLKISGEAKTALFPLIKKIKSGEAILAAGETTVKLNSFTSGKGGRNMEAVLGALQNAKYKVQDTIIMSFASDGRDNTEAAGAMADLSTIKKAQKLKLDSGNYLNRHDSFNFFKKTGDLIFTGQKSFNVSDFMIILKL